MTSEDDFEDVLNNFHKMVGEFLVAVDYQLLKRFCPTSKERRRFMAKFKMIEFKPGISQDPESS